MSDENRENKALVGNAADEAQVQKAAETENQKKHELERAWRELLGTDAGRVVIRDVIAFCDPHTTPFRDDERRTCLAIGRGDVGRYLIEQMDRANPQFLTALMQQLPKSSRTNGHSNRNARGARSRARRKE